jgi:hypothetical protein
MREMAVIKTAEPQEVAAVEKLTAKWEQELTALRKKWFQDEKYFKRIAVKGARLAHETIETMEQIRKEFREAIARAEDKALAESIVSTARTGTPAKRPAQTRTTKRTRK